ncbi:hypothetical protein HYC85_025770 [Camellia sinensis]|uniref:Uncharacterized protein n=1 Tax=Camellia sinensis TaxID=4442 RepID=A0A7J7GFU6_CAMSI|nr:hypothetical protein HYC85_025770 [Camellia sinensis]
MAQDLFEPFSVFGFGIRVDVQVAHREIRNDLLIVRLAPMEFSLLTLAKHQINDLVAYYAIRYLVGSGHIRCCICACPVRLCQHNGLVSLQLALEKCGPPE